MASISGTPRGIAAANNQVRPPPLRLDAPRVVEDARAGHHPLQPLAEGGRADDQVAEDIEGVQGQALREMKTEIRVPGACREASPQQVVRRVRHPGLGPLQRGLLQARRRQRLTHRQA
jgi:hypothetical protein